MKIVIIGQADFGKAAFLERTPVTCQALAERIGPATGQVVARLLAERPLDRLRSVQAILRLEESVGRVRLEAACRRALHYGDGRYRRIKDILNAALDREPLPESSPPVPTGRAAGPAYQFQRAADEFFPVEVLGC